jgi:hypothetical protein
MIIRPTFLLGGSVLFWILFWAACFTSSRSFITWPIESFFDVIYLFLFCFAFFLGPYATIVAFSYKIAIDEEDLYISKYFGITKRRYPLSVLKKAHISFKKNGELKIRFPDNFSISIISFSSNYNLFVKMLSDTGKL